MIVKFFELKKKDEITETDKKNLQKMLDYILEADKANGRASEEYQPTFYIGKDLDYIREVYEDYNGLDSLTEAEQIENGYYRLEIN